jgi:uncharacterized membrane protein YhhN
MGVPIAIFVVLLSGGVLAATRWLPDLAPGTVGGIGFFAVCGLLGAALALLGLHVYDTIEAVSGSSGDFRRTILAGGLAEILFDPGILLGLGVGVYLLAPKARGQE